MIRKVKGGYKLLSKSKSPSGKRKNLGTASTLAGAKKREKQVQYFKYLSGKKK